ncbi:MAG TPA: hypothetical protein VIT21_01440 [Chthoniobacterales bacterium]
MAETLAITSSEVDVQHPWLGLTPFTEDVCAYFYGRESEIEELLRRVKRRTLAVLFGKSGLGKTSLIQAGLFPKLRGQGFLPIYIRLDFAAAAPDLITQVKTEIAGAFLDAGLHVPPPSPKATLWECFHRRDDGLHKIIGNGVIPALAFDQFEEIFTVGVNAGRDSQRLAKFLSELSDLVENRPPEALDDLLTKNPEQADHFDFTLAAYRVLLSLREDYLANLEDLRAAMPSLIENRMRLTHMNGRQALEAVVRPGRGIVQPDVGRQIVWFVAGANLKGAEIRDAELSIDPALLSLFCRELNNERIVRGQAEITADLLAGNSNEILDDFYERCMADQPVAVRAFVEEELLTESGYRENIALERTEKMLSARGASPVAIDQLVNRRLLRMEERLGVRRVELAHDVLTRVVQTSRDQRRAQETLDRERQRAERLRAEQLAQRRKQRVTAGVACLLALALFTTIWGGYYALVQEHKTHYRSFGKRWGFPVGIAQISEAEARRLPVSFVLFHKGIMRDGWKVRWKPAFRMVAINGHLEYMTTHGVGTYLWSGSESEDPQAIQSQQRAESLGLHRVCQWEFVSDAKGNIAYERGLDRDGRMVWGFVYSPSGATSGSRLARFVGPDGFSQLQRGSSAEYVEIRYGKEGREEFLMYRDARNLPVTGPDGAFGRKMTYDSRGHCTGILSLNAQGTEMIDNAGNCGVLITYNENGLEIESTSVGRDLKPMAVKDGYVITRAYYDAFGRMLRRTFHDASGEPVLHQDGNHGWIARYGERGDQTAQTFIGLDGKPILLREDYAEWRSSYDARGRITHTTYFGTSGEPVLHKDGNHGWIAEYDERGNLVTQTFVGVDGKPVTLSYGHASWATSYDASGKVARATFFGVSGEPVLRKEGYHGWTAQYDERGNQVTQIFFGLDGKPVDSTYGYAEWRSSYDARGKITRTTYFGSSGERTVLRNGNHGWVAQYDERGNQTAQIFIGLDDKPVLLPQGYAEWRSNYDERGKITRTTYFDIAGEPVMLKDGYHGWVAQYDERGNQIAYTVIGLDGKPVDSTYGYAGWRSSYDARGKITRTTFFGASGDPTVLSEGNHGWIAQYDHLGNQISHTFIGLDDKPIALTDGYATSKSVHDFRGNVTRRTFHGASGEPVLHKDRNHGWLARYDERGNQISLTFIGLDDKPVALEDGYAISRSTYDFRGNVTRRTFHDLSGKPVLHKDGNHGWLAQHDERGNQIVLTFIGLDEKPMALTDGYATSKSAYDFRGNVTRRTFHGVSGEPVLHKDGNHGWLAQYDKRGNQAAHTFIGLDGKPILLSSQGYAEWRSSYDERGKITRTTYFGASGEPVLRKEGYHGWVAEYDQRGNQISRAFIGIDNKPLPWVVVISEVFPGSKAEVQGIHPNDILVAYADWQFFPQKNLAESWARLTSTIEAVKQEHKTVLVWRAGKLLKYDFGPGLIGFKFADVPKPKVLIEQVAVDYERNKD